MTDHIKMMTREFARDPDSLVFLRLGEALRQRGELEAAASVCAAGLQRYPELPDAKDLYARVLADSGKVDEAKRQWEDLLAVDAGHLSALKGLGFVYYTAGDLDQALDHLETALAVDPTDSSVVQALHVVRTAAEALEGEDAEPTDVFEGLEGAQSGMLLADESGRALGGAIKSHEGHDVTDEVAAYVKTVSREADRTVRLLGLGRWEWLIAEGEEGNVHLTCPTEGTHLLIVRDRSVPAARLAFLANRANRSAREWLEGQRL